MLLSPSTASAMSGKPSLFMSIGSPLEEMEAEILESVTVLPSDDRSAMPTLLMKEVRTICGGSPGLGLMYKILGAPPVFPTTMSRSPSLFTSPMLMDKEVSLVLPIVDHGLGLLPDEPGAGTKAPK